MLLNAAAISKSMLFIYHISKICFLWDFLYSYILKYYVRSYLLYFLITKQHYRDNITCSKRQWLSLWPFLWDHTQQTYFWWTTTASITLSSQCSFKLPLDVEVKKQIYCKGRNFHGKKFVSWKRYKFFVLTKMGHFIA